MADVDGSMTGAQLLVKTLAANGVDRVFGVPGESYLPVLDALTTCRIAFDVIVCRQEGGAASWPRPTAS